MSSDLITPDDLKCKTIKTVYIDGSKPNFVGLVISDLHIGQFNSKTESGNHLVQYLEKIVNELKPDACFILGDIIHKKIFNVVSDWTNFFKKLNSIPTQFHVIPGNHDRYQQGIINTFCSESNVHFHPAELIVLDPKDGKRQVAMGHDLHNDKKCHVSRITKSWFKALRSTFTQEIKPDTLLVLGHLHDFERSTDNLTQSILPFSYDLACYMYGVLQRNAAGEFDIEFKRFLPP